MNFRAVRWILSSILLMRPVEKSGTTCRTITVDTRQENYFSECAAPKFVGRVRPNNLKAIPNPALTQCVSSKFKSYRTKSDSFALKRECITSETRRDTTSTERQQAAPTSVTTNTAEQNSRWVCES